MDEKYFELAARLRLERLRVVMEGQELGGELDNRRAASLGKMADTLEGYALGYPEVEECGCVMPEQSCPLCQAVAAAVYLGS